MRTILSLLILVFAVKPPSLSDGSVFTAMTRLEDLLAIEASLVRALDDYIAAEKSTVEYVEKMAERIKKARAERPTNDTEEFYGSPVEVYIIVKRFVNDWSKLESYLGSDNSKDLLEKLEVYKPFFPTLEDDLYGSTSGLFLLQDTYNISGKQMASGEIPGSVVKVELSADDCYDLGLFALYFRRYKRAREWLNEAVERSQTPKYNSNVNMSTMLEYASWTEYINGNLEQAINLGMKMLQLNPNHTKILDNIMRYRRELKLGLVKTYEHVTADEDERLTEVYKKSTMSRLCREEPLRKLRKQVSSLKCSYIRSHPLLVLKPVKEEVVLAHPVRIVIFREFLGHSDLENIKDIARPWLKRSEAYNLATGKLETVSYRISESTWVHDSASETIKRLNKRAEAATGLDVSTAEYLQVANYGFGGQYEEHHDQGYPNSALFNHTNGNRIATLLLYLSKVQYGGGTAFTKLKTYVRPGKGDAVFWYNLKRSGVGDNSTFHAACPVLTGIKWVANKWFHAHGQEFRRPCLLNEDI